MHTVDIEYQGKYIFLMQMEFVFTYYLQGPDLDLILNLISFCILLVRQQNHNFH